MSSASAHVLGLPELMELTLMELPPRNILVAQAVCKTWKDVIARSLRIRERLFLAPTGDPVAPTHIESKWDRKYGFGREVEGTEYHYDREFEINELLKLPIKMSCYHFVHKDWSMRYDALLLKINAKECSPSFYDKFLTQPPCTTGHMCAFGMGTSCGPMACTVWSSNGIKLQDLIDVGMSIARGPAMEGDAKVLDLSVEIVMQVYGKTFWEVMDDQKCSEEEREAWGRQFNKRIKESKRLTPDNTAYGVLLL